MGHRVRLLSPARTRKYRMGDKTDRTDANALLEANRNEKIKPVPVKTVAQQALSTVHRMRTGWMGAAVALAAKLRRTAWSEPTGEDTGEKPDGRNGPTVTRASR